MCQLKLCVIAPTGRRFCAAKSTPGRRLALKSWAKVVTIKSPKKVGSPTQTYSTDCLAALAEVPASCVPMALAQDTTASVPPAAGDNELKTLGEWKQQWERAGQVKSRLVEIYSAYDPHKLLSIDALLAGRKGDEENVLSEVEKEYDTQIERDNELQLIEGIVTGTRIPPAHDLLWRAGRLQPEQQLGAEVCVRLPLETADDGTVSHMLHSGVQTFLITNAPASFFAKMGPGYLPLIVEAITQRLRLFNATTGVAGHGGPSVPSGVVIELVGPYIKQGHGAYRGLSATGT